MGPAALQAVKAGAAAAAAWFIAADLLGNNIPVFAPLAALLTVQVTIWESVSRGLQRVIGVVVGVLVAYGFARLVGVNAWSIGLVILVSLLAGRALHLGQQGSVQVPVSALLVLVLGATTSEYALDRVVDTLIGAALGILVNLVLVPPTGLAGAQDKVGGAANAMAALLTEGAEGLQKQRTDWAAYLDRARSLTGEVSLAAGAVLRTETALRWHPAGRGHKASVEGLKGAVMALGMAERTVRGIARALADAHEKAFPTEVAAPLAKLLLLVSDEVTQWGAHVTRTGQAAQGRSWDYAQSAAVKALYQDVLIASRKPGVGPEPSAVASAIALDARRVSDELQNDALGANGPRPGWHALFEV